MREEEVTATPSIFQLVKYESSCRKIFLQKYTISGRNSLVWREYKDTINILITRESPLSKICSAAV